MISWDVHVHVIIVKEAYNNINLARLINCRVP